MQPQALFLVSQFCYWSDSTNETEPEGINFVTKKKAQSVMFITKNTHLTLLQMHYMSVVYLCIFYMNSLSKKLCWQKSCNMLWYMIWNLIDTRNLLNYRCWWTNVHKVPCGTCATWFLILKTSIVFSTLQYSLSVIVVVITWTFVNSKCDVINVLSNSKFLH